MARLNQDLLFQARHDAGVFRSCPFTALVNSAIDQGISRDAIRGCEAAKDREALVFQIIVDEYGWQIWKAVQKHHNS